MRQVSATTAMCKVPIAAGSVEWYAYGTMWFSRDQDTAETVEARAHELLDAGRPGEALELAEKLLEMGWSGGFEVKALALAAQGDTTKAIETLESGVEKAPGVWLLWQLLGNLRSDAGRLDAAVAALDAALRCEGASEVWVRFNRAVVQHRRGEPGKALDDLEPILTLPRAPEFAEDALALTAQCLAEVGRGEEGLALVESALDACGSLDPRRPRLEAERALSLDRLGRDPREPFERAASAGVATPALLELGRRLHPAACGAPVHFQLVVQAPLERDGVEGLVRVVDVVADDLQQALELATLTLPIEARTGVSVERHRVVDASPSLEPGVHGASELVFFAEE